MLCIRVRGLAGPRQLDMQMAGWGRQKGAPLTLLNQYRSQYMLLCVTLDPRIKLKRC